MRDSPIIFSVRSQMVQERRFDPEYHYALLNVGIKSPYPLVKLLSLAYFKTGGTPLTTVEEYWGGDLPWVSAKDFKTFRFEDSEDHITELAAEEATTYVVDKPALLMVSRSGILQHSLPVMVTYKRTAINQDIKAFFPDGRVTVDYLGAYFDLLGKKLLPLLCKSGATVQSLNTNELLNLPIPVPPPEVQRQIVAELDSAYAAKRKADEKAAELLASIDGIVLDALGIPPLPPADTSLASRIFTVSAREVVNERLDASFYQKQYSEFEKILSNNENLFCHVGALDIDVFQGIGRNLNAKDGMNLLKVKNIIQDGSIDYDDVEPVSDVPTSKRLVQGDIISPFIGAAILNFKFGLVDCENAERYAIDNNTGVFRVNTKTLMPEYLWIYFQTCLTRIQILRLVGGGGVPYLGSEYAKKIKIIVPSIPVQETIVSKVKEIRAKAKCLKADAQSALAAAKKSIESKIIGD